MPELLTAYCNGNSTVKIFSDGTKIRTIENEGAPIHPESVDLKITNYCDAGCAWCHEQSTKRGKHADPTTIKKVFGHGCDGMEIALGGGNPLAHPELQDILLYLNAQGCIVNMTVNAFHVAKYRDLINQLRRNKLVRGLGVSYSPEFHDDIVDIVDENTIIHVIAGVDRVMSVWKFPRDWKILVLGYKSFGFGQGYVQKHPSVRTMLRTWHYWVGRIMQDFHVSFDNLALIQLDVRDWLTPETLVKRQALQFGFGHCLDVMKGHCRAQMVLTIC